MMGQATPNRAAISKVLGAAAISPDLTLQHLVPPPKLDELRPPRHSNKTNEVKIQTREQGSDKVHEHTCKF